MLFELLLVFINTFVCPRIGHERDNDATLRLAFLFAIVVHARVNSNCVRVVLRNGNVIESIANPNIQYRWWLICES